MEDFFVKKAFVELREDDARRVQSLSQLREMISKNKLFTEVRQGKER